MNNKGLIITLIVLLSIVIVLLVALLCFCINGRINEIGFMHVDSQKSQNIVCEESYETEKINNIEISSTAGDVKIEESTDTKIKVVAYGKNNNDIEVKLENNKLKVENKKQRIMFFGINSTESDIVIYIPKDYNKEINIDVDYGNIIATDLENATINIKEDCGNVELGIIKNTNIKNDYGNVEIKNVLNKLEIKSDCGDIEVEKLYIKENSNIKCDMGNVKIGEVGDIFIDADVDLGETKINSNNRHSEVTLKVEVDCGDVKVEK